MDDFEDGEISSYMIRATCKQLGVMDDLMPARLDKLHREHGLELVYRDCLVNDYQKLLQIIANAYQVAGAHDVPEHILDVLADPEGATEEQIDAMLPYHAQPAPTEQQLQVMQQSAFDAGKAYGELEQPDTRIEDAARFPDAPVAPSKYGSPELQAMIVEHAVASQDDGLLFSDMKTDEDKYNFFLSGQGYVTGVIAKSIQNDVAMAYKRCVEYRAASAAQSQPDIRIEDAARQYVAAVNDPHTSVANEQRWFNQLESAIAKADQE